MLFNSISFAVFLPIVLFLYWFIFQRSLKWQNILLLLASYYFYGCWDWRFLFLLAFSTILDYSTGLKIHQAKSMKSRKIWLILSIGINLGFLGFFKYYNFFAESFADFVARFGFHPNISTLNIILPVGISFYTFHGLSYVLDVYNRKVEPSTNWVHYSLFVSFFPLLVAGPIERATHLLPQVEKKRSFDHTRTIDGLRQILWGFIKKMVIADTCAEYVNVIFSNSSSYSNGVLIVGVVLFYFQIYGDFSGYSDIALGVARLFGFELLKNFNFPFFSRDMAEFWRRWHISLSSWFKDYLYIPLGGSSGGVWMALRNTWIIFLVSGFWHGAGWNYIIWGGLHALFVTPTILFKTGRSNSDIVAKGQLLPTLRELFQMVCTFALVAFSLIVFRTSNVGDAIEFIIGILSNHSDQYKHLLSPEFQGIKVCFLLMTLFIVIEWIGREQNYAIEKIMFSRSKAARWSFYSIIVFVFLMYMKIGGDSFIYFQF